jgi:hypothetical protein
MGRPRRCCYCFRDSASSFPVPSSAIYSQCRISAHDDSLSAVQALLRPADATIQNFLRRSQPHALMDSLREAAKRITTPAWTTTTPPLICCKMTTRTILLFDANVCGPDLSNCVVLCRCLNPCPRNVRKIARRCGNRAPNLPAWQRPPPPEWPAMTQPRPWVRF